MLSEDFFQILGQKFDRIFCRSQLRTKNYSEFMAKIWKKDLKLAFQKAFRNLKFSEI